MLRNKNGIIIEKTHVAEDIAVVIELMQNLNIPTKGCKTVDQMRERIFEHLLKRKDNQLASKEVAKGWPNARNITYYEIYNE